MIILLSENIYTKILFYLKLYKTFIQSTNKQKLRACQDSESISIYYLLFTIDYKSRQINWKVSHSSWSNWKVVCWNGKVADVSAWGLSAAQLSINWNINKHIYFNFANATQLELKPNKYVLLCNLTVNFAVWLLTSWQIKRRGIWVPT